MSKPETAFAHSLKRLKEEQGKSWTDIAEALGHRNTRYVHFLANGDHEPRMSTVRKLADFFGVTPADMMGEK